MAETAIIQVSNLSKVFQVPEREEGLKAAVRSLVRRRTKAVRAVSEISFNIDPGEVVGFLGPNGAGKTTTLKMLSGLLYPSSGEGKVLGFTPSRREKAFLRQITLVMGNRNQLVWDIPALDSFELNRAVYQIPRPDFLQTRDELIAMLGVQSLVHKPIRNLSLGERMKMEIIGSLLHRPRVLFLDEPTIGLDVTMQRRLREFITGYNQRTGASVLLTSHYMADVEALCKRVIVIHHGRLMFDGALSDLVKRFSGYKTIGLTLQEPGIDLSRFGEVVSTDNERVVLRVPQAGAADATAAIFAQYHVADLTVEDAPIDDVIERVFAHNDSAAPETAEAA